MTPRARNSAGNLAPVAWEEALSRAVSAFRGARTRYGRDAAGIFGGGSPTNEKSYPLGKFARVALGASNNGYKRA